MNVVLLSTLFLLVIIENGYCQSFHECFNRINTCFMGLNGYGPQSGRDDVQCAGISTCDGYLTCVKGVQYAKGFVCIPVMGPFCAKTLLDVIADCIGGYLGAIEARFPRCEIDNSLETIQYISNVREQLRFQYGGRAIHVFDRDDDDDNVPDDPETKDISQRIDELESAYYGKETGREMPDLNKRKPWGRAIQGRAIQRRAIQGRAVQGRMPNYGGRSMQD